MNISAIRFKLVQFFYADHNKSKSVQKALKKLLAELGPDQIGLNLGAGTTRLHPQVKNMDIFPAKNIDIVGKAENIPLSDNSINLVITQETLEHVQDPFKAVAEIYRVLKPNGKVYCQLPFIIGYHPGPTDFWRFTKEGIAELIQKNGFKIEELKITVGNSTGFYRIAVEYFACLISIPVPFLYFIIKGFFSLLLYPLKWLDFLFSFSRQKDRIPGGYYVIAKK
jgi:SAM-dependent methyltransferase